LNGAKYIKQKWLRMDKQNKLNERQILFAKEYVKDWNATQAAIRAGYSEKTAAQQAARLLKNVNILKYVQGGISKAVEHAELTADWIIGRWMKIADRCMQEEPVLDRQGNPTGEYRFDPNGANKALENLAKYLGILKEVNINKEDREITIRDMTDQANVQKMFEEMKDRQLPTTETGDPKTRN